MTALFVDTSGWTACADASDAAHASCVEARDAAIEAGQRLITTDFVVDETLTLIKLRLGIAAAEAWWRQVNDSRRLRWERVDAGRFESGREIFFRYRDKGYSFTDCTSFAIMRELRVSKALATDQHFQQMGFTILPKGSARATTRRPRRRGRE